MERGEHRTERAGRMVELGLWNLSYLWQILENYIVILKQRATLGTLTDAERNRILRKIARCETLRDKLAQLCAREQRELRDRRRG